MQSRISKRKNAKQNSEKQKAKAELKSRILDAYSGIKRDASMNVVFMKELLGFQTKGVGSEQFKSRIVRQRAATTRRRHQNMSFL